MHLTGSVSNPGPQLWGCFWPWGEQARSPIFSLPPSHIPRLLLLAFVAPGVLSLSRNLKEDKKRQNKKESPFCSSLAGQRRQVRPGRGFNSTRKPSGIGMLCGFYVVSSARQQKDVCCQVAGRQGSIWNLSPVDRVFEVTEMVGPGGTGPTWMKDKETTCLLSLRSRRPCA